MILHRPVKPVVLGAASTQALLGEVAALIGVVVIPKQAVENEPLKFTATPLPAVPDAVQVPNLICNPPGNPYRPGLAKTFG